MAAGILASSSKGISHMRGASCLKLKETKVAIGGRPLGFDGSCLGLKACKKKQRGSSLSLKFSS